MQEDPLARRARIILKGLRANSSHVQSCALVTFDGLMRASALADGVDPDRFGAMCASLLALSTRAAKEVDRGTLRQVILDGENGPMLLTRAEGTGVLAVAAHSDVNLGKLILEARSTARALEQLSKEALS